MIKKFKNLTYTAKVFVILIILLAISILIRWSVIKEDIKRSFNFFGSSNKSMEQVENSQDSIG